MKFEIIARLMDSQQLLISFTALKISARAKIPIFINLN